MGLSPALQYCPLQAPPGPVKATRHGCVNSAIWLVPPASPTKLPAGTGEGLFAVPSARTAATGNPVDLVTEQGCLSPVLK